MKGRERSMPCSAGVGQVRVTSEHQEHGLIIPLLCPLSKAGPQGKAPLALCSLDLLAVPRAYLSSVCYIHSHWCEINGKDTIQIKIYLTLDLHRVIRRPRFQGTVPVFGVLSTATFKTTHFVPDFLTYNSFYLVFTVEMGRPPDFKGKFNLRGLVTLI